MQSDSAWYDPLSVNAGIEKNELDNKLVEFFALRTNEGVVRKLLIEDYKKYFTNWLRLNLKKTSVKQKTSSHAMANHNNQKTYEQFGTPYVNA